jgi:hypothetical protein
MATVEEKKVEVKIKMTRRRPAAAAAVGRRQGQAAAGGGGAGRADDFRQGVLGGTGDPPCTAYRRPLRSRELVMAPEF